MHMVPQLAYDRAITVFSPDGRLFQVEYAREAVKRGTPSVGIKGKDGVALMVDKRVSTKLLEPQSVEKLFQVDEHIGVATSGLVADARVLVDRARLESQINRYSYDEPIEVEQLAKRVCDFKQNYTQYGGVRPFGTSLLIAGVDNGRARLFETDPSGALLEYKATGIGAGRNAVMEVFEKRYAETMNMDESIVLGVEALYKATEGQLDPDAVEIGVIDLKSRRFRRLPTEESRKFVRKVLEKPPK